MLAQGLAILLLSQSADFTVLRTLDGADLLAGGIDAQVIDLPKAVTPEAFAEQVVQAEHLKAWDDGPITQNERPGALGYKAIHEGSGRSIVVYYARQENGPSVVCRLRTKGATGISAARYRALRWCAGQVGVDLPAIPPPPVGHPGGEAERGS
ncbi:hypothetical protein [Caulobacter hibisci]|uniref:Uncharacterized protein n=1 Tax=Caulobacter hibisci TaxID=2035993 RepID=A0ABS0SYP4_9CAUL|nr:hypothetical protein [Caulobacter hibisci]MBI1684669.1 hypothetical protein [Caulobacter hibisci]